MIRDKRSNAGRGINLGPAAHAALIPKLFPQVALHVPAHYAHSIEPEFLAAFPTFNIGPVLEFLLTCVAAVLIERARGLIPAYGAFRTRFLRIHSLILSTAEHEISLHLVSC